jgi:hypothetical protein
MNWQDFSDGIEAQSFMAETAARIRARELDLGRRDYALTLSLGVLAAIFCNVGHIVAVEFGVGAGHGLLHLCKAADYFRRELGFEIDVYGLDNATGLPAPADYRDHPELWEKGQFRQRDTAGLRARLPDFAKLIIGDVADTTSMFADILNPQCLLGFVSVDVDYYSSTKPCLGILRHDATCYPPAVPMFFDDLMRGHLTYSAWCGEPLAIAEFNRDNEFRKIEANPVFRNGNAIRPFHACQVLDNPFRTGALSFRKGFSMLNLRLY